MFVKDIAIGPKGDHMFCPKCGKDSAPGARFCESCGTALGSQQADQTPPAYNSQPYQQPYGQPMYAPLPLKNSGIAAVLAFLWAGLGHIYLGQIGTGILYMIAYIVLWVIGIISFIIFPFIGLLLPFVFWIWQLYDAYKKANEYNAAIQQTGRAPW